MTFSEWKIWYRELPITVKWLVIIIMIRPLLGGLYYLKEVSPFLSPLYWMGFLIPLFIIFSFLSGRLPAIKGKTLADVLFNVFGFILIFNLSIMLAFHFDLTMIGDAIKYGTCILLFIYFRHIINSRRMLTGVLQTTVYAAIIPVGLMLFEFFVSPIGAYTLSEGRGGGQRLSGFYADIMNYASLVMGLFLISSYFFLRDTFTNRITMRKRIRYLLIMGICLVGMMSIKHTSSWSVFFMLFLLFGFFTLRNIKGVIVGMALLVVGVIFGQDLFRKQIDPLIRKEVAVVEGDADVDRSFNGRMTRWKKYFRYWDDMPIFSHAIGVSTSGKEVSRVMISGGMHSDYVRFLFLTGFIGLIVYIGYLMYFVGKGLRLRPPEVFLVVGSAGLVFLYSASTIPSIYLELLFFVFPVFAYASLPREKIMNDE